MSEPAPALRAALLNRRMAVLMLFGFSSGLPLSLAGSTLQAWLTDHGLDVGTIAAFSLVGLPYALKFLWAPLMDRFVPPFLGRRRGWMIITQLPILLLIFWCTLIDPDRELALIGIVALAIAFLSASQDIVVDAYRTDLLRPAERGLGAATSVAGYRVAMIVSGGLALIVADYLGWDAAFAMLAVMMLIGVAAALLAPEPDAPAAPPRTLQEAVVGPFLDFLRRPGVVALLALIVFYKLGDAFAGSLTTAFLLRGLGFSLTEVGIVNKWIGLAATIVGVFIGGAMLLRTGMFRALLVCGLLQAVTNIGFVWLAMSAPGHAALVLVVALENLAGGMGTAAFFALLMSLCDRRYSATQYALLSALASLGRIFIGPPAGQAAEAWGWPVFFVLSLLAAVPGLVLLVLLRRKIELTVDRG
jgi:PAT family beta-lactamase induction signal transducer AmpG